MKFKPITEESCTRLYHAIVGTPPPQELSEAEKTARLKERCLREIVECKEQEKLDRLARALNIPTPPSTSDAGVARLYEALVS